jgi:hypothetical protein
MADTLLDLVIALIGENDMVLISVEACKFSERERFEKTHNKCLSFTSTEEKA